MKERRKHLSAIAVLLAIAIAANAEHQNAPAAGSTATFAQMKSLVGEWTAVQDGVTVTETYKLTANGTALIVAPGGSWFVVVAARTAATAYAFH